MLSPSTVRNEACPIPQDTLRWVMSLIAALLVSSSAFAQDVRCRIEQLTQTNNGGTKKALISSDGSHVAYESEGVVYSIDLDVGGHRILATNSSLESVDANGSSVLVMAADGLYRVDLERNLTDQIVNATSLSARLSGSGHLVSISSREDLVEGPSNGGLAESFLYSVVSGTLEQLTRSEGIGTISGEISGDGEWVSFSTSENPITNLGLDFPALFLYNTVTQETLQLTDGSDQIYGSRLDDSARYMVFKEGLLNLSTPLFVFDRETFAKNRIPTNRTDDYVISGEGRRVALTDLGAGGRELFLYEVESNSLHQVTQTFGSSIYGPSISRDGRRIVFSSNHSFSGQGNSDGNDEVFLATCGERALFLQDGRFEVTARWSTESSAGPAAAVPMSGESGTFWFFDEANTEVLVKVLDACDLPGFESFWVFAAGLTNLGVVLEVTDTVTGMTKVYENELGQHAMPVLDTRAFDTCDEG